MEQRERQRIAKVLHDHLQQLLVAAKLRVEMSRRQAPTAERALTEAERLLGESIDVTRSLTAELTPLVLQDRGIVAALEWLARQMREKHGLALTVVSEGFVEPASQMIRALLFDSAKEAVFNVVKHAGVETTVVRLGHLAASGEYVLSVEDEGVGFEPERLEPAGFGLMHVRHRLEIVGGRLEIDSSPGNGARIRATVPTRTAADEAPAAPPLANGAAGPPAPIAEGRAGTIRVVLADDHAILRQGLVSLLHSEPDVRVVAEAGDGESAVALAFLHRPDVVVMDVTMPQLNGIEATRRIAAECPGVRVIGLSLHESEDMARAMRLAGAVAYLTKGGPAEQLLSAIRRAATAPVPPARGARVRGTLSGTGPPPSRSELVV